MGIFNNIEEKLNFINISTEVLTLFEWKPPRSFKSYVLDLNIVKKYATDDVFFHIDKGNMRIVHIKKKNLIYTIGSSNEIQFQLLEAILEHLDKEFHEIYDIEVIFSYGNVTLNIFKSFKSIVDETIKSLEKLDLTKKVDLHCRVCGKKIPILVKKSIINNAESYPVPIVYIHGGHAILTYIDSKYNVRGQELVSITG